MSTEFFNDQWRIPSNENQNKISNYSMDFTGINGNINLGAGSPFNFNTASSDLPFSFSMWFNKSVQGIPNNSALFAKNGDSNTPPTQQYRVLYTSGKLRLMIAPQGTGSGESFITQTNTWSPNNNQWYHLVFTYDGRGGNTSASGLKMYIDKVEQTVTITQSASYNYMITTTAPLVIGSRSGNSNYTNGSFDLFSVFDYELTQAQINILYGDSAAGYFQVGNPMSLSPAPVAYYQLGDQSVDNGANYLVPNNSLSGSEGYSPYALDFDGTNDQINCGNNSGFTFGNGTADLPFSVSFWINPDVITGGTKGYFQKGTDSFFEYGILFTSQKIKFRLYGETQISIDEAGATALVADSWNHVAVTYDGTGGSTAANGMEMYINGSLITVTRSNSGSYVAMNNRGSDLFIGSRGGVGHVAAEFSNFAVFNTELTSTEVTEIYSEGIPQNLNNHSAVSSLVSWWQLGSNSSFNTNWTCLDEIGTSNGVSANMTNDDIVNGVGYSANGLGTSSIDIKGDAPYSSANGLSENMDVLDRTTDVPS